MIKLTDIWPVENPHDYKVHFASWNGHTKPLDVLVRDPDEWRQWQEYRPKTDQFNLEFIFSLARVYYEKDSSCSVGSSESPSVAPNDTRSN